MSGNNKGQKKQIPAKLKWALGIAADVVASGGSQRAAERESGVARSTLRRYGIGICDLPGAQPASVKRLKAAGELVARGASQRAAADATGLARQTLRANGIRSSLPMGQLPASQEKLKKARDVISGGGSLGAAARASGLTRLTLANHGVTSGRSFGEASIPIEKYWLVDYYVCYGVPQRKAAAWAGIGRSSWQKYRKNLRL